MKKLQSIITKLTCLVIVVLMVCMTSCQTALKLTLPSKPTVSYQDYGKGMIEFIGFKGTYTKENIKNVPVFANYGRQLEAKGIAIDRSDFYLGIYSLQELYMYKGEKRYVAFVDVLKYQNTYNDNVGYRSGLALTGWMIAGLTCFTLFPVYVPMVCAANSNECTLNYNVECVLYIYDTESKQIVLRTPYTAEYNVKAEGQYMHKDTDRGAITEYQNALFWSKTDEAFRNAERYLSSHQ